MFEVQTELDFLLVKPNRHSDIFFDKRQRRYPTGLSELKAFGMVNVDNTVV